MRSYLENKIQTWHWWFTPVILATWEAEIGRIAEIPSPKITRAKWTGDVTQAVEHLLCKHEALSSNPVTL
jgi:hypothetical protein